MGQGWTAVYTCWWPPLPFVVNTGAQWGGPAPIIMPATVDMLDLSR